MRQNTHNSNQILKPKNIYNNLSKIKLFHGDANKLIKNIKSNSVNLIATDPPYEIDFEKNYWDKPNQLNWNFLAKEFRRILKPNGSIFIFQGWSNVV